jgi:molybdopterin-guanine dinucleotide biosynthesis protein A
MGAKSLKVGGLILCGGQSRRMGRPKAWLPFGRELMLPRVARLLGEAVSPVVIVAAQEQELPPVPPEIRIVHDEERDRGPLQGLKAGLEALKGRAEAAYLSSCDVPFLKPEFVRKMIALLGEHHICVPRVGGYHHPLAAVYRLEVADTVARLLEEERLRPVFLFESEPTRIVTGEELCDVDPAFESLRNLNTSEDYEQALREAERESRPQ